MFDSLTGSQTKLTVDPLGVELVGIVGPCSPPAPQPVRRRKIMLITIEQPRAMINPGFRVSQYSDKTILRNILIVNTLAKEAPLRMLTTTTRRLVVHRLFSSTDSVAITTSSVSLEPLHFGSTGVDKLINLLTLGYQSAASSRPRRLSRNQVSTELGEGQPSFTE